MEETLTPWSLAGRVRAQLAALAIGKCFDVAACDVQQVRNNASTYGVVTGRRYHVRRYVAPGFDGYRCYRSK